MSGTSRTLSSWSCRQGASAIGVTSLNGSTVNAASRSAEVGAGTNESSLSHRDETAWLPFLDTYRTMCHAPEPAFRRILEEIRGLHFAA
jgi:hypothetical protein